MSTRISQFNPSITEKKGFKKLTLTILTISLVVVQVIFLKHDFLSDAGMELTCCAQMKAENMQFAKLVLLFPIGALLPEIFASKVKIYNVF